MDQISHHWYFLGRWMKILHGARNQAKARWNEDIKRQRHQKSNLVMLRLSRKPYPQARCTEKAITLDGRASKKDVASTNFSLHEAHCLRFLEVCPECDEPVPHKDMKEHQDESHRKVRCKLCNQNIQQYLLEAHEKEECGERAVKCAFCELELAVCKLQEHADNCGSRTELCPDCKKYVMLKDLDHHKNSCLDSATQPDPSARKRDPKKKLCCPKCSILLTESTYLRHQNECNPLSQFVGPFPPRPSRTAKNFIPVSPVLHPWSNFTSDLLEKAATEKVDDDAKQGEFNQFSFGSRNRSLRRHETSSNPTHVESGFGHPTSIHKINVQMGLASLDDVAYDVLEACAQCNILLPSPTLKQHEKKCKLVSLSIP